MNLKNLMKKDLLNLNKIPLNWFFLNTQTNSGVFNMACDSFLLESIESSYILNPILRIYSWDKETFSVGANQKEEQIISSINSPIPIVKRITGGQAVLHGIPSSELTYSIFLEFGNKVKELYFEIGKVFLLFLKKYGLRGDYGYSDKNYLNNFNCFKSRTSADIVVKNIKVIGSAQYRRNNYVLQHGSIKLDIIKNLSGKNISFSQARDDLKDAFQKQLKINFSDYLFSDKDYEGIRIHEKNVKVLNCTKIEA